MRAWTIVQIKRVRKLADQGYSIDRLIIETGLTRRTILTYIRLSENPNLGVDTVIQKRRHRKIQPQSPTPIAPIVPLTPPDVPVSSLSPNVDDGDTHTDYSNKALENARSKVNGTARRRKTRK